MKKKKKKKIEYAYVIDYGRGFEHIRIRCDDCDQPFEDRQRVIVTERLWAGAGGMRKPTGVKHDGDCTQSAGPVGASGAPVEDP